MSFAPLEASTEASEPIELYKFLLGSEEFLFCNTEDEITFAGDVYLPEAIQRGDLATGKDERKKVVTVSVSASNILAQKYIGTPPGERASLSIFRQQRQDGASETILIYKGSILAVQFPEDADTARISLQSIEAASSRAIPRMTYMHMCNHILYDDQCKVDPLTAKVIGAVSSTSGPTITVVGASASGLDFTGGFAKSTTFTDFRLIIAQSGDDLELLLPFQQDPTGSAVEIFAGCDHLLDGDCSQIYSNEIEYGGFYFVPNSSIFQTGIA